jgi:hypothetical protein
MRSSAFVFLGSRFRAAVTLGRGGRREREERGVNHGEGKNVVGTLRGERESAEEKERKREKMDGEMVFLFQALPSPTPSFAGTDNSKAALRPQFTAV